MTTAAREIIAKLGLAPLPGEGGFFRVTWRSDGGSAILFLLTPEDFSAWHRIAQDELWHFHAGDPVEHLQLHPADGTLRITRLGGNVLDGDVPQVAVARSTWQAARLWPGVSTGENKPCQGFALLGCTVTPPWNERGFELGKRDLLQQAYPTHRRWIAALTR